MNKYITIREAVEKFNMTQYAVRKAVKTGQIRFCICKAMPKNNCVTLVYIQDILSMKDLSPADFVPIGILSRKYKRPRSLLYYYRSIGAVRWQQRGGLIAVHRKDCESLLAQKQMPDQEKSPVQA